MTTFIKQHAVLCIALVAAVVTAFFVPPDSGYIDYIDFKTITCLFCTLAVVCALRNIKFFRIIAEKIVCIFKTARRAVIALIYITFIGSMLIANDMALITFLPLGYYVLSSTGNKSYMAFVFIMQNIAANLGGMLTPFGNPQNLYLYSFFEIENGEFVRIMLLPFSVSVLLITLCCLRIPNTPLLLKKQTQIPLNVPRACILGVLFFLSIAIVFDALPYWAGLVIITAGVLILDYKALLKVDYGLLFTFAAFFVFAGNMARIPAVDSFLSALIEKDTLLFGALSCQFISNVPSAILLSQFTGNYPALLVAVNIGGTGTLIASLASLITFSEYTARNKEKGGSRRYLVQFSLYNFAFLGILLLLMKLVGM